MSQELLDVASLPDGFRAYAEQDEYADTSYLKQEGFEEHLERFRAGDFAFCSVILERTCPTCGTWECVGSLSGIEHDGTQASVNYLEEVAMELHGEVA